MSRKVYSLYHSCPENNTFHNNEYVLQISCKSAFAREESKLEESQDDVVYHNSNYYLSFSRAALVKKAKEIRQEWIDKKKTEIQRIEAIEIK